MSICNEIRQSLNNKHFRWFLVIVVLFTVIRTFCSMKVPLSGDEAYYYIWSKHLSFGYYDHPPVIAWMIAFFTGISGNDVINIRFGAVISSFFYSILLFFLAKEITKNDRIALFSGLLIIIEPYFSVEAIMITPDAPLLLFWTISVYLLYRALRDDTRLYWIFSGIAVGMAFMSKLMGGFLIVSLIAYFFYNRKEYKRINKENIFLFFLAAFIIVMPFLLWNAANEWKNFGFQVVERHKFSKIGFNICSLKDFIISQAAIISPCIFILFIISVYHSNNKIKETGDSNHLFCLSFSLPIILFFTSLSLFEKMEMYWPIAGYVTGNICISSFIDLMLDNSSKIKKLLFRIYLIVTFLIPLIVIGLLYYLSVKPDIFINLLAEKHPGGINNFKGNGITEMYAYEPVAGQLIKMRDENGGKDRIFIMAESYCVSSSVSYYAKEKIHIYSPFNLQGTEIKRYEDYESLKGKDALFVDRFNLKERRDLRRLFTQNFDKIEFLPPIEIRRYGHVVDMFYLAICRNFSGKTRYNRFRKIDYSKEKENKWCDYWRF